MEKPLISVIIPTYKVEKYIKECLDSIINQSYKNLEIIIVDDKSPDDTVAILRKYEKKDSRIKAFVLDENSGSASAGRNKGLEIATGEYCTFVDSDDCFLDNDAIEKLYQAILETETDLVVGYPGVYNSKMGKWEFHEYYHDAVKKNFPNQKIFTQNEVLEDVQKVFWTPWAKLYNLSLIKENNIKSPYGIIAQDFVFLRSYLLVAKKGLTVLREPIYLYKIESGSNVTRQRSKYYQLFIALNISYQEIARKGYYNFSQLSLNRNSISIFLYWMQGNQQNFLASYLYFKTAKNFFKENPFKPNFLASLDKIRRRGIHLTRRNALLGYFYFGYISDPKLMKWFKGWKETYLIRLTLESCQFIAFSLITLLKIIKQIITSSKIRN